MLSVNLYKIMNKQEIEEKYREIARAFGLGELSNFEWHLNDEVVTFDLPHYCGAQSNDHHYPNDSKHVAIQKIAEYLIIFLSDFIG